MLERDLVVVREVEMHLGSPTQPANVGLFHVVHCEERPRDADEGELFRRQPLLSHACQRRAALCEIAFAPDRVHVRHRVPPCGHGAGGIGRERGIEARVRPVVPERVQREHSVAKMVGAGFGAAYRKVDPPEPRRLRGRIGCRRSGGHGDRRGWRRRGRGSGMQGWRSRARDEQ